MGHFLGVWSLCALPDIVLFIRSGQSQTAERRQFVLFGGIQQGTDWNYCDQVAIWSDMVVQRKSGCIPDRFDHGGYPGELGVHWKKVTAEISRSQILQVSEIRDPTKAARLCQCHRSMMQVSGSNYTVHVSWGESWMGI